METKKGNPRSDFLSPRRRGLRARGIKLPPHAPPAGLTLAGALSYTALSIRPEASGRHRVAPRFSGSHAQTHLSAQRPPSPQDARLPRPHEIPGRAPGAGRAAPQGTLSPRGRLLPVERRGPT